MSLTIIELNSRRAKKNIVMAGYAVGSRKVAFASAWNRTTPSRFLARILVTENPTLSFSILNVLNPNWTFENK